MIDKTKNERTKKRPRNNKSWRRRENDSKRKRLKNPRSWKMERSAMELKMVRSVLMMTRKDDGQDEDDISEDEDGEVFRTKCLENILLQSITDVVAL